jgi:UDP-2,3-diacylglucosamine hydrolase
MPKNSASSKSIVAPDTVLGIVAGDGHLPVALVQAAKEQGAKTVVLALSDNAHAAMKPHADTLFECAVGQLGRAQKLLQQEKVSSVQFVGTVPAMNLLFNMHKLDSAALNIITKLPNLNHATLQRALGDFMESSGFQVLEQSTFLDHLFPQSSVLSKRIPTDREYLDIAFGLSEAQQLAENNEGQTVVVRDGKVISHDGVNGTDQTVRLALRKQAGGVVVCKVARSQQDRRFYIPSVGLGTLKALTAGGRRGNVLAIRSGETMVLELDAMIDYCDRHDLSFVAIEGAPAQAN